MAFTPRYLLGHDNGRFFLFETGGRHYDYDIVSYCWGKEVDAYYCTHIDGVEWPLTIRDSKVRRFKELMLRNGVQYMWVDSLCINKEDKHHEAEELSRMFEYYKNARNCYLLIDMPALFDPHRIASDLKLLDHILSNIGGASMVSDAMRLSPELKERHRRWAEEEFWVRDVLSKPMVRTAGIDLGVLNCYNTCVTRVQSLFANKYFTRVWTFQEMIQMPAAVGKNIQIVGVAGGKMSGIGPLHEWMDLASDCRDKAAKLYDWINDPRAVRTSSINVVLAVIDNDLRILRMLQTMVRGINAARTDIINGGQFWWRENPRGISNIFSAISITPRGCSRMHDLFRGLLGIFSGLFAPDEIQTDIAGDDIEKISFAFFKRLSTRTGHAWTKLAVSSRERGEWDWIPVTEQKTDNLDEELEDEEEDEYEEGEIRVVGESEPSPTEELKKTGMEQNIFEKKKKNPIKTDIFAGVTTLGVLRNKGRAKTYGLTGLLGVPRKFMTIHLKQENPQFHFIFRGCNCGKKLKAGLLKSTTIPTYVQPIDINGDETGRILAQCATILGCVLDPGTDPLAYKMRLLSKLDPQWQTSDASARPWRWPERCVSGTRWADPNCRLWLRTHNMSMHYRLPAVTGCESRLASGSTAHISCELRINCGCVIIAPFSLLFEALTAVQGSALGGVVAACDRDDRIVLNDGLGLVQIGDLGKTFNLVAFGGDLDFHRNHALQCRRTKDGRPVEFMTASPQGRALLSSDFTHGFMHMFRNYGYVRTEAGHLLICRNHPLDRYKIKGVCIDQYMATKNAAIGEQSVTIK
ncbi:heterokaryon incompatibility protein-domain-containing protein [Nemania sp. FL0916]|nr:heterokaryon incompatibility protein-domain-containing protein [Nemania sp. FL0916]